MLKRTPVPVETASNQVQPRPLRVMGVDPGFANLGLAVLERTAQGIVIVQHAEVIVTKKASKKEMRDLRVSADDQRRYAELWAGMEAAYERWQPQVMAMEVYTPYKAQGGTAFKASIAYGVAIGFGLANKLSILPFVPQDIKTRVAKKKTASKEDVQTALFGDIAGLAQVLNQSLEGAKEHLGDAAAHGYLGLLEVERMRKMAGVA